MMPVRRTQNWLPSIFNDFFDNEWMEKANATAPAINVLETEKEYKVELAAPGMTKDDFNVHIDEDNNLVISMEKKTENKEEKKDGRYLRREFSYSKFQQTMISFSTWVSNVWSLTAEPNVKATSLSPT